MGRRPKELTIDQQNEYILSDLSKLKWINPTPENIAHLRTLSSLCMSVSKARAGAATHLHKALMKDLPGVEERRKLLPYAEAAVTSACWRLSAMKQWRSEYSMYAMFLADAADHLNIAKRINDGASQKAVRNMLWRMDTASRDAMHPKFWSWLEA